MYSVLRFLCFIALTLVSQTNLVSADRIKDLTSLAGIRTNQLVGYGVVVGLAGSGDGNTGIICGEYRTSNIWIQLIDHQRFICR